MGQLITSVPLSARSMRWSTRRRNEASAQEARAAETIRQQIEQIEALSVAKQRVVSQMIDAMLQANASS